MQEKPVKLTSVFNKSRAFTNFMWNMSNLNDIPSLDVPFKDSHSTFKPEKTLLANSKEEEESF